MNCYSGRNCSSLSFSKCLNVDNFPEYKVKYEYCMLVVLVSDGSRFSDGETVLYPTSYNSVSINIYAL